MLAASLKRISSSLAGTTVLGVLLLTAIQVISVKAVKEREPKSRFACPRLPESCWCNFEGNYLSIQCPMEDPDIIVRNQPGIFVDIECAKTREKDYNWLPEISIGDTRTVKFKGCPLPKGKSFESILKEMGARHVRTLIYDSHGTDLGSNLTKEDFLGLNELERLVLSRNNLSDLPLDLLSDLRNLTWLDLKFNRINLHRDIFATLENLEFLDLSDNDLHTLEPGVFRNQKRLKHLIIWGNNFQNLTVDSFEGVASILDIDLSRNKLRWVEPDVFKLLPNLKKIDLSDNNFTSLPEGLFTDNKKISHISLLGNLKPMETLPSEFLSGLSELEVVKIEAAVKSLPEDMFIGSENVRDVSLANNQLEVLPAGLFVNQRNLMNLDLSRNRLLDLPDNIFSDTTSLVVLDLSFNKLENITSGLFVNLHNLTRLYLQNNNLVQIHWQAFIGTLKLEIVEAQNNHLFTENGAYMNGSPFRNLSELKILNLRNNSFSYIFPDWISNFRHLQNLDLSYNKINTLNITDLEFSAANLAVNLSHNTIRGIYFSRIIDTILNQKVTTVDIGGNPLLCDCNVLHFVQFLRGSIATHLSKKLNIASTELQCVEPQELTGRSVQSLDYNELLCPLHSNNSQNETCPRECKCWWRPVDLTVIVNCSDSGLRQVPPLPNTSEFDIRFIELYVENNNLTKLPDRDHPGYSLVSKLYAKNNKISQLTAVNIPSQLSVLDISNNSISWMNARVFEGFNRTSNLTQIYLGNNPWRCDCDALPLLSFIRTSFNHTQDLDSMRCPSGAKLSSLSAEDLCKLRRIFIIFACLTAVLGMLFGFMAAWYYRFQPEIKAWLYAHNMCLWFVTEEELDKDKKYDAFISYSHKDEEFITDQLLPNLENGPVKYKLCIHERNWVVGDFIPNQIIRSVEESRRTIVVLSPNFLESVWGRMEFQAAHKSALQEGRARVIVIIYGEIGDTDNLDPEIKAYLTMNTYIKWGDPWFWKKLRYALPHPSSHGLPTSKEFTQHTLKKSADDKLDLITGIPTTPPPLTTPPAEQAGLKNLLLSKSNTYMANSDSSIQPTNGYVNCGFIIKANPKEVG